MLTILISVLLLVISTKGDVLPSSFTPACPPDWEQFMESCYHIENKTMSLPKAEKRCASEGATLFVANSLQEFDYITKMAPRNFLSWIGLAQFEERASPIWQTTSGIEPSNLKWLVSPFSSASNGWSSVSRCAAHLNSDVEASRYTYFYPCDSLFNSICENNFTFNSVLAQQFQQL